jgi:antitoxin component of RelBE/YafQ-DinJ toxin-antitoxin module
MNIPKELRQKFKSICAAKGLNMTDVVLEFITQWVKENSEN